jgi:hypothetical protein
MPKTAVREEKKMATQAGATKAATRIAQHAHHWVIASPQGEYSLGTCKVCGKSRKFPNSADDNLWQRNVPQSRWTGRGEDGAMSGY